MLLSAVLPPHREGPAPSGNCPLIGESEVALRRGIERVQIEPELRYHLVDPKLAEPNLSF